MIKINLRKSALIQKELFQRAGNVEIEKDVELNEYNNPEQVIEIQLKEVTNNIVYKQNLLSVLYSLQAKTGIVNAKWDVNKLVAEQERIKACINLYTNLCERKPRPELLEIQQRIEKLKERGGDSFSTNIFGKKDINEFKQTVNTLKKNSQDINDTMFEVSVKRTIELSADEEQLLIDEGLL